MVGFLKLLAVCLSGYVNLNKIILSPFDFQFLDS